MGQRNDPLELAQRVNAAFRTLDEITDLPTLLPFRQQVAKLNSEARTCRARALRFRAAALVLYTERRLGELLHALGLHGGDRRSAHWNDHPTVADWGLTRSTVSRAYALATVPLDQFRSCIDQRISQNRIPSQRSLLELASQLHGAAQEVAHRQFMQRLREFAAKAERFPAILLTPRWRQESRKPPHRQLPVAGMTWKEVAQIPIPEIGAPNSHLYVWVDAPSLPFVGTLAEKWGYAVATVYCHRTSLGSYGNWCHDEVSMTLVATRGHLPSHGKDQPNWRELAFPGGRPSDDLLQEMVESFSPPPYLHIFGVSSRPNWSHVPPPGPSGDGRSS